MSNQRCRVLASQLVALAAILLLAHAAGEDLRRLADTRISPCPSNSSLSGHHDVASFVEDMKDGATEFMLCPGISYDEGLILLSTQTSVEITCLDQNEKCVWEIKEGSHLVVEQSVSVTVVDILFKGATNSSIQLKQPGGPEVHFTGCGWQENQGFAVIEAFNVSMLDISEGFRLLQNGSGSESDSVVVIEDCVFQNNSVEGSLLYTDVVNLWIESTIFIDNVAGGPVIDLQQGFHEFRRVAFENNIAQGIGLVYLSGRSRLNQSDLCGSGNRAGEICNGTFLQIGNPDLCDSDNQISCSPGCNTYQTCDAFQDCVASTEILQISLASGGNFQLCNDTVINLDDLDEPLEIAERAFTITCASNCTIEGGRIQFRVVDGATSVLFQGVEFSGSQELSFQIEVDPTAPSTITFRNCEWSSHQGDHVIVAAAQGGLDDTYTIEAIVQISESRFVGNDVGAFVVENGALMFKIEGCVFESNVCQGVVGGLGGLNQVDDSFFENNAASEAVLAAGLNTIEFITGILCGSNNTDSSACNGTLYEAADPQGCREDGQDEKACAAICDPFPQCDVLPSDCYSTYVDLKGALQTTAGGTLVLCPDSRISLDENDEPIEIAGPGTILKCGDDGSNSNNCVIFGGSKHVIVNTDILVVMGITFLEATSASVHVVVDQAKELSVTFSDCYWVNNTGVHTVEVTNSVRADLPFRSRNLQDESANFNESKLTIANSTFVGNTATSSIVSNAASNLLLFDIEFINNQPGRSVVSLDRGESIMANVQFMGNSINVGVIFVGLGASLNRTDNFPVCGMNNTPGDIPCDSIVLETLDSQECVDGNLEGCRSTCSSLPTCTEKQGCYSQWSLLTDDVKMSSGGQTFVVCPDTEFSLTPDDEPLLLSMNDTIVRCGDGRRENRCVVVGGENQLVINGTVIGLQIEGLTFVGSSNVSVAALGDVNSTASFIDCEFTGHNGYAVIFLLNFYEAERWFLSDGEGDAPSISSMHVAIDTCLFNDNMVNLSPVVNIQGDLNVSKTTFSGNYGMGSSGAIAALFKATLEVSGSCFVGNSGSVSGAILLSESASLDFQQRNNFGVENLVVNGSCTDILSIRDQLSCDDFGATECLLESSNTTATTDEQSGGPTISSAPSSAFANETNFETPPPTRLVSCFNESGWEDLFGAVTESQGDDVFTICANTTINMTEMEANELAPLLIRSSGITLQCESRRQSSCVFTGGTNHILLQSTIERVTVKYITMEDASGVSVAGTPNLPFSVEFESCFWSNNSGASMIEIIAMNTGDVNNNGRRDLQNATDNFFVCDRCFFEQNTASDAIISTSGTTLIVEATDFQKNAARKSLISVQRGALILSDSCIVDSKLASGSALLSLDDSGASTAGLYFQGNGKSSCTGYIDKKGNCVESDTSPSCIALEKRCYSHWEDLSSAIARHSKADRDSIITLCENSRLDVSGLQPIEISRGMLTIRCGHNGSRSSNCQVFGGSLQFVIVGTPVDVAFSGITFSSPSVAAIHAAGGQSARGQILDCLFNDMPAGQAAVLVYSGDLPLKAENRRKLVIGDYTEPNDRSMTVEISYSTFSDLSVELAPVANLKGTLVVLDSTFDGNRGIAGGVGEWFSGSTSLSNSCFTGNTGKAAGAVYIDGDSTTKDNNYSNGNTANGDCADLFLSEAAGSEGLCVAFIASACGAGEAPSVRPTSAPTMPNKLSDNSPAAPIECIGSWKDLANEVASNLRTESENVFTICPGDTILVGDEPIMLNQTNGSILLECGLNGRLRDNCSFSGGRSHFRIVGEAIEVTFRGIKLKGSTEVSILAGADKESSVRFFECEWTDNKGLLAVLVFNEGEGKFDVLTPISERSPTFNSMSAAFEECIFSSNPLTQAVVLSLGGQLSFSLTTFEQHRDVTIGSIVARGEALVSVSNCCFIENDSNLPGTIHLSEQSELIVNEKNFGFDNRVGLTSCTDIFTLAPGEDCGSSSCPGICSSFDGRSCSVQDFEYDAPSTSPSDMPLGGPSVNSPNSDILAFKETSILGSDYFLRNLVVASIVVVLGFTSFFYCKSLQGKPPKAPTKESAQTQQSQFYDYDGDDDDASDDMMMGYDTVVLDPVRIKKKEKKASMDGFINLGNKKQKQDAGELAPMVADGLIMSPSVRVGGGDYMDQDLSNSRFNSEKDVIEIS